ncbi:glycosyltransferase family 4 protein [bacterium]|nr:glycosyltransferase family 4 protein [bacterium]
MRVFLVEGEDRYFLHNRRSLAKTLADLGCRVEVLANQTGYGHKIQDLGFVFHPLNSRRGKLSLGRDLGLLRRLAKLQLERRPDLVHNFTLKPVLFNSLVCRLRAKVTVFNSITGLGYLFTDPNRNRFSRPLAKLAYRLSLSGPGYQTIVQNEDDRHFFLKNKLCRADSLHLIRGSGVDCQHYRPSAEPDGPIKVLFIGRFLGDKGIHEYIQAAQILKQSGSAVQFVLAGDLDPGHPTSIKAEQLQAWVEQGLVQLRGYSQDIAQEIRDCHIVVLPSHREGLPKALIEGAASGRPLIAADAPGSREVVLPEKTGLLVDVGDSAGLARAITRLASSQELRASFGSAARELVQAEFSSDRVTQKIVELYRQQGVGI